MARVEQHEDWIRVSGIAAYCMVTPTTVRRWIKKGEISTIRLPSGHYRVSLADFREFLERHDMPVKDWLLESKSAKKGGKQ